MTTVMSTFGEFLEESAQRSKTDPIELTVRQLLGKAGQKRRGYKVVRRIEKALADVGLRSEPSLDQGWIDSKVRLVEAPADEALGRAMGMKVSQIPSATCNVVSVCPNDRLEKAISLMEWHDYSQLPVISGREQLRGAITWRSIAEARLRSLEASLPDALLAYPPEVACDDDLLPHIPRVLEHGFAFVRGRNRTIVGIVTPYDLSECFLDFARPFLLLDEIERRLRTALERTFTTEELRELSTEADAAEIQGVDDLSLGTIVRLIENPTNFERLEWSMVDRREFMKALQEVRSIRNEVVHFSPDPIDLVDLDKLRKFAIWLRVLEPDNKALRPSG